MCLIVDNNKRDLVFGTPNHVDAQPIHRWLARGGLIVYGGHLKKELSGSFGARQMLAELVKAGRARDVDRTHGVQILRETEWARTCGHMRSDDPHIIGLARATGARVLCTDETRVRGMLSVDFKDRRLVPNPQGKIYRRAAHHALLMHSSSCLCPIKKTR